MSESTRKRSEKNSSSPVASEVNQAEVLVSADSHLVEPEDLWKHVLDPSTVEKLPPPIGNAEWRPGATVPGERLDAMKKDDVSMEIIYPSRALTHFGIEEPGLQERCFSVYNDWLVEYCEGVPGRLLGVPAISAYDIRHAIQELERSYEMGLRGALLWHVPPPSLQYGGEHYDPLWAAMSEMNQPLNLHILTGFSYAKRMQSGQNGWERYRAGVNLKLMDAANILFDFIFSGVLDRFPELKLVLVEFEIGWIPWVLQQWDFYVRRFRNVNPPPIEMLPSEYFDRQVYATFFNDSFGTAQFQRGWGLRNCMWSSDFPHGNTTWPNSRTIIDRDLGVLGADARARLLSSNVLDLYQLDEPSPING